MTHMIQDINLDQLPLGKKIPYDGDYDPKKLFPIPRQLNRSEIGITGDVLPFFGVDIWQHFEVSWLNKNGKPVVAIAQIIFDCDTKNIIESKSMKLYFHSLNNTKFNSIESVEATIKQDIQERINGTLIDVFIRPLYLFKEEMLYRDLGGKCLDELDIHCSHYHTNPEYLITEDEIVEETLYSDLLKSNCLVTNQPDWSSIQISYKGNRINHEGLLRYLVSFRNENEFHEQCTEKIFTHIIERCKPSELTIDNRGTRRGGIGITSYRSTKSIDPNLIPKVRLHRQ